MKTGRNHPSFEDKEGPYRSIFDSTTDGLIITDLETGRVLEANPAACAMHGYACAEFIGLLPAAFIHPDSQKVFSKFLREFRSGGVFDTRVLHVRRDGSTFHAEWRGTAFTYKKTAVPAGRRPGCQPAHSGGTAPPPAYRRPLARAVHAGGYLTHPGLHPGTPARVDPGPIARDHRIHPRRAFRADRTRP